MDEINKITSNPMFICAADPERFVRKVQDSLESILRYYQASKTHVRKPEGTRVTRHLILSAPGQGNQATFKEWREY